MRSRYTIATLSSRLRVAVVAGLCAATFLLGWIAGATRGADDDTGVAETRALDAAAACRACDEATKPNKAKRRKKGAKKRKAARAKLDPASHQCNICGSSKRFKRVRVRKDELCPDCKSKARHRLLVHYLEHETKLFSDELDVLHFGPNAGIEAVLRKTPNLHYVTADLFDPKADLQLDITAIDQPNASWDVVIAYHILEHIVDDKKAMRELFRILRPGGQVILQVPLRTDRTEIYEDASITDREGRKKAFGQGDHVRRYSADGLRKRLEDAGFEVEAIDYLAQLDPELVRRHKLEGKFRKPHDQRVWVARKPERK